MGSTKKTLAWSDPLVAARELARRAEADPIERIDWFPPQDAFLRCLDKVVLGRGGNQAWGKTEVGVASVVMYATGTHPYDPGRVCHECWILCASWSQSLTIQERLWALTPKRFVAPGSKWDSVRGFGGHSPALRLRGPFGDSTIRIKTTQQGALNLAGSVIDLALFDEPPANSRVFGEVLKRVQSRGTHGRVLMTLTPINGPVEYLQDACKKGLVRDLHFPLVPENLIHMKSGKPRRLSDGTVCDEEWIKEVRRTTLPFEEPVRCDGEWECKVADRLFEAFDDSMIRKPDDRDWRILVGIDHGTEIGDQHAVIIGVDDSDNREHPMVHVLAEVWAPRRTTPEADARAMITALRGLGIQWGTVAEAWGDIPAGTGVARRGNLDLEDCLARDLLVQGGRQNLKPRIGTPKQGKGINPRGAVSVGSRWLHNQMLRGRFAISPQCTRTIEAFNKHDGRKDGPHSHPVDATRYALRTYILGHHIGTRTMKHYSR